ncbi:MAG TPA: hypothetical protein VG672_17565 [Bryobacteraceae bacterium]|nr:hypothetical protein [Bryobacteraceae bacterium]
MMLFRLTMTMALVFAGVALGEDAGDARAKLVGSWQVQGESGENSGTVWAIQDTGDGVRVTRSKGGQTLSDQECNTVGKECSIKDSGHKVKVSMWYNGPKLVELETRGSDVVKRRFSVAGEGDALEIELIPISPVGKAETLHLKRVQVAAGRQ